MRVLVLGGTGEARTLAGRLVEAGADLVSSLAGQVTPLALPDGRVRIGGFGGVDGLTTYLRDERVDRVVDATHPFAATITRHAVEACQLARTPLLVLRRPAWREEPGDRWTRVPDIALAAAAVRDSSPGTVLLTTGRGDLAAFADDDIHDFIVRAIEPPHGPMPARSIVVLDRGPYDVEGETALMRQHDVGLLVTKDSGGSMTAAKLTAARDLGLPVLLVDRPALPDVDVVSTVDSALAWAVSRDGGTG